MNNDNLYRALSEERKQLQEQDLLPAWISTAGYQLLKEKYLYEVDNPRQQYERIARTAAKHMAKWGKEEEAYTEFFNLLWKGWLSPSTPVLANMGTDRGMPVSCSGGYIADSIVDKDSGEGFYQHYKEVAALTKNGFGTSGYMGDIRPRGAKISVGGKASGVLDVFTSGVDVIRKVSQGTARRGAWAGYLPIEHGDFYELADHIAHHPDDANVGWTIKKKTIEAMNDQDVEVITRLQRAMKTKMVTGKGYYVKTDTINEQNPQMYKDMGLEVNASNLCAEITLFSGMYNDLMYTFTCVLSSMNLFLWDEWKNTKAVYWATIFLDCVAEEFIQKAKGMAGLEAAVRFTESSRALGLGAAGFHSYLQEHMIPFESLEAHMWNNEVFKYMNEESLKASQWMAEVMGEPEWCKGYGVRNTHRMAVAPTKSTALIMGGISEGINPDAAMIFTQNTPAGEVERITPTFLNFMKKKGVYSKKHVQEVIAASGSVQGVDWLDDFEKSVFKTAFEINQEVVIRLADQRARFIDQSQSVNLFFSSEEEEEWIGYIHWLAFNAKYLKSLYYIYTLTGVHGSKDCEACQ